MSQYIYFFRVRAYQRLSEGIAQNTYRESSGTMVRDTPIDSHDEFSDWLDSLPEDFPDLKGGSIVVQQLNLLHEIKD